VDVIRTVFPVVGWLEVPIRRSHVLEMVLIATITVLATFGNPYTSKSVGEILLDLASPYNRRHVIYSVFLPMKQCFFSPFLLEYVCRL
jgi:hypothetical protein